MRKKRTTLIAEIVNAIKLIKVSGWQKWFVDLVSDIRR